MKLFKYSYLLLALIAYSEISYAQISNRKIVGKVLDDKNQPIEFALLKVNNSKILL
jgi:hypothetical protein